MTAKIDRIRPLGAVHCGERYIVTEINWRWRQVHLWRKISDVVVGECWVDFDSVKFIWPKEVKK